MNNTCVILLFESGGKKSDLSGDGVPDLLISPGEGGLLGGQGVERALLQQPQHLYEVPDARLAPGRLEPPPQHREGVRQRPPLQRRGVVERPGLPLQERQVVDRF